MFQLMRKFFVVGDATMRVLSVTARDDLKGMVYVEAMRVADVQEGCGRITNLYSLKPKIVALEEMTNVFTTRAVAANTFKPSQYVRLKRTKYSGDLAQIVSVDEGRGTALVRCIPRIDLDALKEAGLVRLGAEMLTFSHATIFVYLLLFVCFLHDSRRPPSASA